jgi:hypothetical protein
VELDTLRGDTLAQIERIGTADLVVGVLRSDPEGVAGGAAGLVREAIGKLSVAPRAVVIHDNGASRETLAAATGVEQNDGLVVLSCSLANQQVGEPNLGDAYRTIFAAGQKLAARTYGVIASDLRAVTPQWIYRLVQPSLEEGFDLVAPCYEGHKFEGLLNKSIVAPLHRALYGVQIQNPLGPDFGFSGKLAAYISGRRETPSQAGQPLRIAPSIATDAVIAGLRICETNVGVRLQPPTDSMNLGSIVAQIIGPIFLAMEQNAAVWQRVRGSKPVPRFAETAPVPTPETGSTDVSRMLESFQLGAQNLTELWGLVLPPKTMLETVRLARLPANQFRMPDDLWVSIIFDFALGHRLRTISRDHLLRSLTPLYLGWVASYALEMETAGPQAVEARLERLSRAYEAGKTYLMSRWRWPDRFNP